jgi:hypothetical protein
MVKDDDDFGAACLSVAVMAKGLLRRNAMIVVVSTMGGVVDDARGVAGTKYATASI